MTPALLPNLTDRAIASVYENAFLAGPPYIHVAAGLAAIALAFLIIHLATQRSYAERRARESAAWAQEVHRRDSILEAMSYAAAHFLRNPRWEESIPLAIERFGRAAGVSRVAVYQAHRVSRSDFDIAQISEWLSEEAAPELDGVFDPRINLSGIGLARWRENFLRNRIVVGPASIFPDSERAVLDERGIRSILAIPICVDDVVWGALVLTDHARPREWPLAEREILCTAADMIGAAVERTRTEAALREAEDRFRQMAEHIREVFLMTDASTGEILYLSPAYEELWGRSREEVMNDPLAFAASIIPEDRHLLSLDATSRAGTLPGNGPSERRIEYRIHRPDGAIRWIQYRSFPMYGAGDSPDRIAGVCTDITEQKELEEELRRANRIEAIGQLAAGIAHEINTPIQYISGNLEFLDEGFSDLGRAIEACRKLLHAIEIGAADSEKLLEAARILRDSDIEYVLAEAPRASAQAMDGVHRVAEIVRAMKDFSQPGTGRKICTDLNQAIRSTITVARNEWKYVAELEMELDPLLPSVPCYPSELNQAILNLVVNAAHSIADRQKAEGTIDPGMIVVSTTAVDGHVEIRIRDTGTGIPAEVQQRIFDPFFTTKEVGRGSGQGLTFVHSTVVEHHGGAVSFVTEPGIGTTFIVRLPNLAGSSDYSEAA